MTISRRNALPVALFSLLGGRIAVLVASKEEFSPPEQTTFDAAGAIEASRAAGQCPVQSCNKARLTEMQFKLDTSKYAGKPNEKGDAASHRPLVWVEPIKQEGKRPYAAKVVMVAPESRGDTVQLMWLANGATQQIIGSKVIESASSQAGVVSGAAAQGANDGPPTLVATAKQGFAGVERGSTVVPYVLYANDGLWQGEPITLCDPGSPSCPGAMGPADFPLDTRGRRPRGEIGAELLRKAAKRRG